MKKFLLSLLLSLILVPIARSQTSVTLGISGADDFDNKSAGLTAGINIPVKLVEFNLADTYSPYETHVGQGIGHANISSFGTTFWVTHKIGLTGRIEDSGYSVTKVSKTAFYVLTGVTIKKNWLQIPTRFGFGYAQQINKGIINGVETSQLHGAYLLIDGHIYCSKNFCIKMQEMLTGGQVSTQGNPVCDGTLGNGAGLGLSPCPRGKALGGGAQVIFSFEQYFHKHNADEATF